MTCALGYAIVHYHQPSAPLPAQPPATRVPEVPAQAPPRFETDIRSEQRPQPLANCIGPDNLINEAVATCRFGKFPDPVHDPTAQGMVSAHYMQQYKAERVSAQPRHKTQRSVDFATVWQWDRKRSYRAEWLVTDNQIEGSSVCRNWRPGSIEYRECRKGAKIHFREQCRKDGAAASARQRYCSAESSFNPM
ncbi:hypothetical protein TRP66_12685 [Pseudomonas sp. JDS28PS106]|uniref:hypothetical protein n=1 Tax=Pseudomonas sp. JDS28PS106 TaxID=2497235 RepID=UPI002FCEBFA9